MLCLAAWERLPVVVHVADEHGVEGVQVPAEHGKLIPDGAVLAVHLRLALHAEVGRYGTGVTILLLYQRYYPCTVVSPLG